MAFSLSAAATLAEKRYMVVAGREGEKGREEEDKKAFLKSTGGGRAFCLPASSLHEGEERRRGERGMIV